MKKAVVYKITNLIDGRVYIGQTMRPETRYKEHFTHPNQDNTLVDVDIRKLAAENFSYEVLDEYDITFTVEEKLNQSERKYIEQYNSLYPNGYNIQKGGSHRATMTPELREKFSKSKQGEKHPQWGNPLTAEHKQHIYDTYKERGLTEPVVQLTLSGEFVAEYFSSREAARAIGKPADFNTNIVKACKGKTSRAYGYKWQYKRDYEKKHNKDK